jgi:hypothetical protein
VNENSSLLECDAMSTGKVTNVSEKVVFDVVEVTTKHGVRKNTRSLPGQ